MIETSADFLSVAIVSREKTLARYRAEVPRSHAENLVPAVQSLLAETGIHRRHIDAIGVGTGPGSYTGLRIGVSAAKGYALAIGCKLIGVSTFAALAAMAESFPSTTSPQIVLLPARKNEWYFGYLASDEETLDPTEVGVVEDDALVNYLKSTTARVSIVTTSTGLLDKRGITESFSGTVEKATIDALGVARIARLKYEQADFADIDALEPDYLRKHNTRRPGDIFEKLNTRLAQ